MAKSRKAYPAEFREQIVELAHSGKTAAQLSREFGPTAQCISYWIGQDARKRGQVPASDALNESEREELRRLRGELLRVQQERDILAKATAWFAARNEKTSMPSTNS